MISGMATDGGPAGGDPSDDVRGDARPGRCGPWDERPRDPAPDPAADPGGAAGGAGGAGAVGSEGPTLAGGRLELDRRVGLDAGRDDPAGAGEALSGGGLPRLWAVPGAGGGADGLESRGVPKPNFARGQNDGTPSNWRPGTDAVSLNEVRRQQDKTLDRIARTDDEAPRQAKRRRPRRPTFTRKELRLWDATLAAINAMRTNMYENDTAVPWRDGPSRQDTPEPRDSLLEFDRLCQVGLGLWEHSRRESLEEGYDWGCALIGVLAGLAEAPPHHEPGTRGVKWTLLHEHADGSEEYEIESVPVNPIVHKAREAREHAERFLSWARDSPHRPRTQRFMDTVVALFATRPDALGRIRRCQHSGCLKFFLDTSPTYRTSPAKGCTRSHTVMAKRERNTSRP